MTTSYLSLVDQQTDGRNDITPLFNNAAAVDEMIADLVAPFVDQNITHVAGIDALGFILGAWVAASLGVGFIPIRKADKLPVSTLRREFIDYTGHFKSLEIRRDAINKGDRVLVVDDWIETGAQMKSALDLLEEAGAEIVGVAVICMDVTDSTNELRTRTTCHDLWDHT